MKDILLKRTSRSTYDWDFMFDDVKVCNGNKQLIQAVKHAVLLRPDELAPEIYNGKGCKVHDFVKQTEVDVKEWPRKYSTRQDKYME